MLDGDKRMSSQTDSADSVVVCGAGAAGMAAALSAARRGSRVSLIEAGPRLGGTVADALIHTLGGLYDSAGEFLNHGLAKEMTQRLIDGDTSVFRRRMGRVWVLNVCPNLYRRVVEDWIAREQRITVFFNARVASLTRKGNEIVQLEALGPQGAFTLRPKAVIDATGSAEAVSLIDQALCWDDTRRAAGGWVFRMRGVTPGALAFPKGIGIVRAMREAAAEGALPSECGKAWIDQGVYEDEAFVKLFVPLGDDWRRRESSGEISQTARQTQDALATFLQRLPEFDGAKVTQTGQLGVRDGGRVHGEYCLSKSDVQQARKFPDAVCRCCWPIEYWDAREGVTLEHLPPGAYYEIPMRSLRLPGLNNVWVAGKCLSADRFAQASARVAGTCWSMGEAVGKAAALHEIANETRPEGALTS